MCALQQITWINSSRFPSSAVLVCVLLIFHACEKAPSQGDYCTQPRPSDIDTLRGEYIWSDLTGKRISQRCMFLLQTNGKFFMRVDKTIANPIRRFSDMSANYRFHGDQLILSDTRIDSTTGGSYNVPDGVFNSRCENDSLHYIGGPYPDTSTRIAIPQR